MKEMGLDIPAYFFTVFYNGRNYPRSSYTTLQEGANCQVFAYAILEYYGIYFPPFRSSELWEDQVYSTEVSHFQPLDLLLFHSSRTAFGAHVTVFLKEGQVIHLAKHHGSARIERIQDLLTQDQYRFFIGAKRGISSSSFQIT